MKKLIYIFFSALVFTACGGDDNYTNPETDPTPSDWNGDWNDKNDKNYKPEGYNPIEGEWEAYSLNGKEYTGYYFVKFDKLRWIYEYNKKPDEGKDPAFKTPTGYLINDIAFKTVTDKYYKYNVKNNILTLIHSSNTWLLKPYAYKEWRWEGNWNDPKDEHYTQYQGKYNPIKGRWLITHVGDDETLSKSIITFNEEFKWIDEHGDVTKYQINKNGIKSLINTITYQYKIENRTLTLQQMLPKKGVTLTYKQLQ